MALALPRVSRQQVVEVALVGDTPRRVDGCLRFASGEEIASHPGPAHQVVARLTNRSEHAQPLGKPLRKRGRVQFRWLLGSGGEEQTRLEERQPRRHDQIVGGKLETQFAGGFDKQQILLSERQNGDARQVDPLPSSKLEQQVKRPLETIEVDGERGFARRPSEVEICAKPFRCQRITSATHRAAPGGVRQGRPETHSTGADGASALRYRLSCQTYSDMSIVT